jgi:HEAT repeat protein
MACYILGQVGYTDPNSRGCLLHYPEGVPTLVRHLESDPDENIQASAAFALGFQKVPSSLPALCRAARHPSAEVRYAVAHALGSFYEDVWEDEEARRYRGEVIPALLRSLAPNAGGKL